MAEPEQEVCIDAEMVRVLLASSSDDELRTIGASGSVELMANGWDNVLYRVGPSYLARLPRRELAVELAQKEQYWLEKVVATTRIDTSVPLPRYKGAPSEVFPWPWSVVDYYQGVPLGRALGTGIDGEASDRLGSDLATFVSQFQCLAPPEAPVSPYRGMPLSERYDQTASAIVDLKPLFGEVAVEWMSRVLRWATNAPPWAGPPRWIHGDLHPWNIIWDNNALRAVIDFGDMTPGDPATDFAVGWWVFDHDRRQRFAQQLSQAGVCIDEGTFPRACGWALSVSAMVATTATVGSELHTGAVRTLERIVGAAQTGRLNGFI